jgi:long-chain fatty acid transport protein
MHKCFLILILFFSHSLWAAFGNYNSILVGEQAAGMGGAYTALSEDSSALSWYNPAGLAFLKGQSFSAAVGIYKKFDTHYGGEQDFTKASLQVNQGFFRALPSSTGSIIRIKDFMQEYTFAFSIIVPEYDTFKGDVNNSEGDISSLTLTDESLWVGGSISKKTDDDQSFGLSLYYTARSLTKSVTDKTTISATDQLLYSEEKAFTQNSLVLILGYQYRFAENWSLGASFRSPSMHIAGAGSYYETLIDTAGTTDYVINLPDLKSKTKIPRKYALGLSWRPNPSLLVSSDLSIFTPESYSDLEGTDRFEYIEHIQVINVALGAEYALNNWLKFRVGGFTNFSSHPNPDPQKVKGQGDRVDQLGFAANAALRSGRIQYTFGGYYTGGWGRSVQRLNQNYEVITKSQQVFTMLVGNSFNF